MYRFDSVENLQTMKNVCMFIRIYNDLAKSKKNVQNMAIREVVKDSYGLDIPLFDVIELKRKACEILGKEDTVPTIEQLDDIIDAYIKNVNKKATILYNDYTEAENSFKTTEYKTSTGETYTGAELRDIYDTLNSKFKVMKFLRGVAPLLFGVLFVAGAYGVLYSLESTILSEKILNQIMQVYLPAFAVGWLIVSISLGLSIGKSYRKTFAVVSLYRGHSRKISREAEEIATKKEVFEKYIKMLKFEYIEDGKVKGAEKLSYYLRIDNTFSEEKGDEDYQNKKFIKKLEKNERLARANEVKEAGFGAFKIDGWYLMNSSSIEKKNINRDLVSRIGLLTDSLKENKLTDKKEYNELVELYCGELSGDSREREVVKQNDQIKLYTYYINMVEKLLPYERFVKQACGLDYDGEKYSERTATDDEKQFVLNYMWYIIETELKRVNYIERFKAKVIERYTNIKTLEMQKIITRVDLYKLYLSFLEEFQNLIVK